MKINKRGLLFVGAALLLALVAVGASSVLKSTQPVTLPEGTTLNVRLDHGLASDAHRSGDTFAATVADAVRVRDKVVIPAGAPARGHVVEARESGRLQTPAVLTLALDEVEVGGTWFDVETAITGRRAGSHKKRNWLFIGGGSAGGALIGAQAGGGAGAAIGASAGAGAGTAAAAMTGKKEIRLPAETLLRFKLTDAVTVDVPTKQGD